VTGTSVEAANDERPTEAEEPATTPSGPRTPSRLRRLLPWGLAAATLVLAGALPLAPVVVDTPEVQWPLDPTAPVSTTALFMPYRPIDVVATLPCETIGALAARQGPDDDPAVVLATAPADSERGDARSLSVTTGPGSLRVLSSGRELYAGPLPDGADCELTLRADQTGTTLVRRTPTAEDTVLADAPGTRVPEVTAFITDVTAADGPAPTVTAHPDARFQSSPTTVKQVLVALQVLAIIGCLTALFRAGPAPRRRRRRGSRVRGQVPPAATGAPGHSPSVDEVPDTPPAQLPQTEPLRPRPARRWRAVALLADAAVVLALLAWTVLGYINTDDYYYSLEARAMDTAGFVGNQVRYFNTPEVPFVLHQMLLAPLSGLSASPLVLRLPSLIAALLVWWLLTRHLVPLVVERPHPALRVIAAVAFLAWWLPWNIGARPEFLITLAWATTLTLALQAIRRDRVWLIGLAALVAGAAVTVTASGLSCAATLLVLLPRLWPVLQRAALGVWASLALVVASASVASTIVFTDSTLATARTALRVHREVGPAEPWWLEILRYWYLTLAPDPNQKTFARQVVVLGTLVLVVGVSVALLRVTRHSSARTSWAVPALAFLACNAALLPSPTKWTHHFGALAAPGALVLTVGVAILVRRRPDRWASGVLLGGVALAAGLAYHGGNNQVEYSAYGVTRALPAVLGNPLMWAALGVACASVAWWFRRRRTEPSSDRSWPWPEAVVGALAGVLAVSVLIQIGSAALANYRLRDTWSMAGDAMATVSGRQSCGFADEAVALTDPRLLPQARGGSGPGTGRGVVPEVDPESLLSLAPAGVNTWSTWQETPPNESTAIETPWLEITGLTERDVLALAVTGEPTISTTVTVEYGIPGPDGDVVSASTRPLVLPEVPEGGPAWQRIVLGSPFDLPPDAAFVRLRLADQNDSATGWLAATDAYLIAGRPVSELVGDDVAVLDWPIGFNMPCIDPPRVADGMVEPAQWLVQGATYAGAPGLTVLDDRGGSYSTAPEVFRETRYPAFLPGVGYSEWGFLVRWEPRLPTGAFELERTTRVIPGWGWWPGAGDGPARD
jgi:arabinosyltransferase C